MQSPLNSSTAATRAQPARSRLREVPRVLLVDDCPLQRILGVALLSRWSISPEIARDGSEAVLMAGEQKFDVILMDLNMPVVDGFAATESIRRQEGRRRPRTRVPVVAYTANDFAFLKGRWLRSGMDAFLKKPSVASAMGACLSRWCPNRLVVDTLGTLPY